MTTAIDKERAVKDVLRSRPKDGRFFEFEDCQEMAANLGLPIRRAWSSRYFTVQLRVHEDGYECLSVQRAMCCAGIREKNRDKRPITWDELQLVKARVGFGDRWAVEVYPPDQHLVDVALMRHLWLVDKADVPFAWLAQGAGDQAAEGLQ